MRDRPTLSGPIFITGANGWLGRRLTAALLEDSLASGRTVRALVPPGDTTTELLELGVDVVAGDIRDPSAVASFLDCAEGATVIHLAGVIHPPDGRVRTYFDINVLGAEHVVAAASVRRARRIVAMSSNSPFGANPRSGTLFDEHAPYRPYMGYGRSKQLMEQLLLERASLPSSPEIVIVRAPWFYGPGQPPRQSRFFSLIRNGRFPIIGDGENRRSMAYVDDLATGIMLAANAPSAPCRIYWLADPRPYAMNEIIGTVRSVLADDFGLTVSARQVRLPGLVGDVARLADGALQRIGRYQQEIHVLSEMNLTIACSIDKAREELGYSPKVGLREGMRRSVEWCLDSGIAI